MNYIFVAQRDSDRYDNDISEYFEIHDNLTEDELINVWASCLVDEDVRRDGLIDFYIYENGKKIWSKRKPTISDHRVYELLNKAKSQASATIASLEAEKNKRKQEEQKQELEWLKLQYENLKKKLYPEE